MNKRQVRFLAAMSILAVIELHTVRIALPVFLRRWPTFPGIAFLQRWEIVMTVALMAGAVALVIWLAATDVLRPGRPRLRKAIVILLAAMGLAEIARLIWPALSWLDSTRHVIAVAAVVVIASDALLHGTAFARASVGVAGVALFAATLYRGVAVYFPAGPNIRWLATVSETAGLLVPWVMCVAVTRRQLDDFIALVAAIAGVVATAFAVWGLPPAIHVLVAQALGFRFALPPVIHVLTAGAVVYFLVKAGRSPVIPARVTWAYIWIMACGLQMTRPYVQMGSLVALTLLAWTPPYNLPREYRRFSSLERPPVAGVGDAVAEPASEDAVAAS